ncbi:cupin-like domain-containing protein [Tricladium varicosporioides]|nr:cupin-like domain-containing protein [Hymenoscyphus varicosporioides]
MSSTPVTQDPITTLLTTYNELNSPLIDELDEEPSPLEFMRYVAQNRPFVVRGGASGWEACKRWNVARLKSVMEGMSVNVAVTPKGNADSPTKNEKGEMVFVKPYEEEQLFSDFIEFVSNQEKTEIIDGEIRYAQTQNDNLRNEYSVLFKEVQKDIPWARIALNQTPEAINFWLGNSHTTTSLHKDPYENIYVTITGTKTFTLLPPIAFPFIRETLLTPASYSRSTNGKLVMIVEEGERVPVALWDPDLEKDRAERHVGPYEEEAKRMQMKVEVGKGDMLYLPALWYHKVGQIGDEEGICIAVNYWHDMEFSGSFYPLTGLVRSVVLSAKGKEENKSGER